MIIPERRWIAPSQRCSCWPKHIPLNLLSTKPLLLFLASLFPSKSIIFDLYSETKRNEQAHLQSLPPVKPPQGKHTQMYTNAHRHTHTHTDSCQNKGSWSWAEYKIRLKTVLASLIPASCLLGFTSLWQTQMQMIWRHWKSWTHVSKVQK